MLTIRYNGSFYRDFDTFPPGTERSVSGALPLVPGRIFDVTYGECGALIGAGMPIEVLTVPSSPTPQSAETLTTLAKAVADILDAEKSATPAVPAVPAKPGAPATPATPAIPAKPDALDVPAADKSKKPK